MTKAHQEKYMALLRERFHHVPTLTASEAADIFWILERADRATLDQLSRAEINWISKPAECLAGLEIESNPMSSHPLAGRMTYATQDDGSRVTILHRSRRLAVACVTGRNLRGWRLVIPEPYP